MALRTPLEVKNVIDSGIEEYTFEKEVAKAKAKVETYIDPSIEEIRITDELKQKYSFLADFMEKNRINVVKQGKYDDSILEKSGEVTSYKWGKNGIIYYIVKNNGEIIKVPHNINDRTGDPVFNVEDTIDSDLVKGEKVGDFVDEDTRYILEHDYDNVGNDQSPLYVIEYNNNNSNGEHLVVKDETEKEKRLRRSSETVVSIKAQVKKMEIGEKLPQIECDISKLEYGNETFGIMMYNEHFYTKKDKVNVLGTYVDGGNKISEIVINDNKLSLNIIDNSFKDYINIFLNSFMRTHFMNNK